MLVLFRKKWLALKQEYKILQQQKSFHQQRLLLEAKLEKFHLDFQSHCIVELSGLWEGCTREDVSVNIN